MNGVSPTRLLSRHDWVCILLCPSDPGLAQWFPRQHDFLQDAVGCVSYSTHLIPVSPNGFLANTTSFKMRLGVYLTLPIRTEPGLPQDFPRQHDFLQDSVGCVSDSAHPIPVSPNGFLANTTSFKTRLGVYLTLPIRTKPGLQQDFSRQYDFLQDAAGCVSDSAHPIPVPPMVSSPTRLPSRYG